MRTDANLSQAEVRGRFDYDPETGLFTCRSTGKCVGSPNADGYLNVKIAGRSVGLHRLAFVWMLGHWPLDQVDHANGNPSDNRWANLRPATARQNAQNRRPSDANFGYKGVKQGRNGRWTTSIMVYGKVQKVPGSFESAFAAHQAYRAVATRLFGQYARFDMPITKPGQPAPAWKVDGQLNELKRRKVDLLRQIKDVDDAISGLDSGHAEDLARQAQKKAEAALEEAAYRSAKKSGIVRVVPPPPNAERLS